MLYNRNTSLKVISGLVAILNAGDGKTMFRQLKKPQSSYGLSLNGLGQKDFAILRQYNLDFSLAKFLSSPLKIC